MKKLLILLVLLLSACVAPESNVKVNEKKISLEVGEGVRLPETINEIEVVWESSNSEIAFVIDDTLHGVAPGYCFIVATGENVNEKYLVVVKEETDIQIEIIGPSQVAVGEEVTIEASINVYDAVVKWETDNDNVEIEADGNNVKIAAKKEGIGIIRASYLSHQKTYYILVSKDKEALANKNVFLDENIIIDLNNSDNLFEQLVILATSYSHQLYCYKNKECVEVGTLVIYKREVVDNSYLYYAITNRHTIKDGDNYKIKYASKNIDVELVQYDLKVDIAVMKFTSDIYFPIAQFGDSDNVQTGEFVIAIGNQEHHENTANVGIVSYPNRYVSDDTDDDGISDWDAQYVQHDAPLSDGSSGGPLINMKGEVIGMNTMKLTSDSVENMGFAIPSNLILELTEILETGVQPNRPILGVSIINVSDILISDYQQSLIKLPEGITYGMYISEVTAGGLADIAGMKPGDILLKVDGEELRYSHVLRAQLGKMIYGSGESFDFTVYRDGEEIILTVVF